MQVVSEGEDNSKETEVDAGASFERGIRTSKTSPDLTVSQDVNASPKPTKMKKFPQMLLSDNKLKRSKLMTRRESQALLEGVRKNRGLQSTQSCNN